MLWETAFSDLAVLRFSNLPFGGRSVLALSGRVAEPDFSFCVPHLCCACRTPRGFRRVRNRECGERFIALFQWFDFVVVLLTKSKP